MSSYLSSPYYSPKKYYSIYDRYPYTTRPLYSPSRLYERALASPTRSVIPYPAYDYSAPVYGGWMECFEEFGITHVRDLKTLKVFKVENQSDFNYLVEKIAAARELRPGETVSRRREFSVSMVAKLALLLHPSSAQASALRQAMERLRRTAYGHVDPGEVMLLLLRWSPSLTLQERRMLSAYTSTPPSALLTSPGAGDVSIWDTFRACSLVEKYGGVEGASSPPKSVTKSLEDVGSPSVLKGRSSRWKSPTKRSVYRAYDDDLALLPYRNYYWPKHHWPYAADDELLHRPYSSWWHRYHGPTRWRYWASKYGDAQTYLPYDPYYDSSSLYPYTSKYDLDYPYARPLALAHQPLDWTWNLDELDYKGRRLLVDPVTAVAFEEVKNGDLLWPVGKIEYSHFAPLDPLEQWNFIPTLSKRLHRQHSQVNEFFHTWAGGARGGGEGVWLPAQALRRMLRWLIPDISLSEVAALQAVLDTNKQGHVTRMELYHCVDDMAALLQTPRQWLYDEIKGAVSHINGSLTHSRKRAVTVFEQYDSDGDGALRPCEVMECIKSMGPSLTATERRRVAMYSWCMTVITDTRRLSLVEMMRGLQLCHPTAIPGHVWPHALTAPEYPLLEAPDYVRPLSYLSPSRLSKPYLTTPDYPVTSYATPPRPGWESSTSKALASPLGKSVTETALHTPAATMSPLARAMKDTERAERSVHKLQDAENLLKEAVDLYKAANDVGRQRAAENNLSKVGTLLREARWDKADKDAKLDELRMSASKAYDL